MRYSVIGCGGAGLADSVGLWHFVSKSDKICQFDSIYLNSSILI